MEDSTVTITITLKARAGYEERTRGLLRDTIAPSMLEDGCLEYRVYESMIYPLVFMIYMRWRDEESYLRHAISPHVKAFDELLAHELLAGPYDLKRWTPVG